MKSIARAFILGLLIYSIAVSAPPQERRGVVADPQVIKAASDSLHKMYTADQLKQGVYVGSNLCLSCHKSMTHFQATNHSSFIRRPLPQYTLVAGKGVIANSLKGTKDDFIAGLDFNTLTGTPFDKDKPNAPKLSVEKETYYVTVGTIKAPVVATLGGQRPNAFVPAGSAQRYLVRIPVSDGRGGLSAGVYMAPFTYAPGVGYVAATAGWYDATTNAPKLTSPMTAAAAASAGVGNYTGSCLGCHTPAVGSITKTAAGEYQFQGFADIRHAGDDPTVLDYENDGNLEVMNIGCEACHGAGSNHVLHGGDPASIVNPRKLSVAAQTDICGRCHANGRSVPSGAFTWPYDEASGTAFTPFEVKAGKPLSAFYAFNPNLWPDGAHVSGGRPYNAYKRSAHALAAQGISCTGCHSPHAEGEGHLLRQRIRVGDLSIPTKADDNTLCLSCHAARAPFASLTPRDVLDSTKNDAAAQEKIKKMVEAHTHHPYAPERTMGLSRCTTCHMAAGHNFDVIPPAMTVKYATNGRGMINSCAAACHNNKVDVWGYGFKGSAGRNPSIAGTNISIWTNPFDLTLATKLNAYFGDSGTWWKTRK
jgi:hypothetical protein